MENEQIFDWHRSPIRSSSLLIWRKLNTDRTDEKLFIGFFSLSLNINSVRNEFFRRANGIRNASFFPSFENRSKIPSSHVSRITFQLKIKNQQTNKLRSCQLRFIITKPNLYQNEDSEKWFGALYDKLTCFHVNKHQNHTQFPFKCLYDFSLRIFSLKISHQKIFFHYFAIEFTSTF